jgi:GntR family transcriptional regulator
MASVVRPIKTPNGSLPSQAQRYLRDLIQNGTYQPGQQLPPEAKFADQLGISRPTLREALHFLEMDGFILRKHGVGTFVSPNYQKRFENGLEVLESLDHIAARMGLATEMGKAEIEERPPKIYELAHLERGQTEIPSILSVTRTILVETRPVAHLWDIVPTEYLNHGDLSQGFHGSVLDIFLRRGSPVLDYSLTELTAISAGAELAHQLNVPPKSPLMQLKAKLCTPENRVVDFSISYFVPDFFNFHVIRRIGR